MTCKDYETALKGIIVRPELQPSNGVTHCNAFLQAVAHLFNIKDFDGLMANQIFDLLEANPTKYPKQTDVTSNGYMRLAKDAFADPAKFIVAAQKDTMHGHVCVVAPTGGTSQSGHWNKVVCNVANVGKTVFYNKGLNFAFSVEPTLYDIV